MFECMRTLKHVETGTGGGSYYGQPEGSGGGVYKMDLLGDGYRRGLLDDSGGTRYFGLNHHGDPEPRRLAGLQSAGIRIEWLTGMTPI